MTTNQTKQARNRAYTLPEAEKERRLQELRQRLKHWTDEREENPWLPRIAITLIVSAAVLWAALIIKHG